MEMSVIKSELLWCDFIVLRMLRRRHAAVEAGEREIPNLIDLSAELGVTPEAAIALHSVFQLTEGCLGRPLEAECCCSQTIGPDERAILALMASACGKPPACATRSLPHGLPGALAWAVETARRLLNAPLPYAGPASDRSCPCPTPVHQSS
ncbi:hypothetical protein [Altericroceibacterium xinjiangense]|uniref:hypothetical protein n=1 Tax=Altericroceibacterium xinjiangense TaxID=762261 RepID=UPI0013DF8C69|nr:hypothetical protein [Altericroceibacterium xinjiangense]